MSKNALIEQIEKGHLKSDVPPFKIGDTLKVSFKIIEGEKERLQSLTGTVIARKGSGLSENVTLYRTAYGSAMERAFMLHSPRVVGIEVVRQGKTRRSKLYHIRGKMGKQAKVSERITAREAVVEPSEAVEKESTES